MKYKLIIILCLCLYFIPFDLNAQSDLNYYSQAYDIIVLNKDSLSILLPDSVLNIPEEVTICISEISWLFVYMIFTKQIINELYPDSSELFKDSLSNIFAHLDDIRMTEAMDNDSEYQRDSTLRKISGNSYCNCNYLIFFTNISEENVFSAQVYYSENKTIEEIEKASISYFNFQRFYYFIFIIENGIVRNIYSRILTP